MADTTQRLFIAIDTPPGIKAAFRDLQGTLKATGADVRWERSEKLHCTLKFLGDTDTHLVERISATLRDIALSFHQITIVYRGVGFFPPKGDPKIVWVGMNDDDEMLGRMHTALEEQCATLGYPREERRFHPHVTLGRVRSKTGIGALRRSVESVTFESQPIIISSIDLLRSTLKPDGSLYSTIARFPLQPAATR